MKMMFPDVLSVWSPIVFFQTVTEKLYQDIIPNTYLWVWQEMEQFDAIENI